MSSALTVWITGASSGIGRELALQLAKTGHRVIISARNAEALQELALLYPQQLLPMPIDIADTDSLERAKAQLTQLAPVLDLAILNAGTCEYLDNGVIDVALIRRVMTVNFDGTINAAALAMPLLKKAKNPALYVVSSQVTTLPLTRSGAYGASKAALEYFFRCLRIDVMASGIFIGIVRPGFVKTPLTDRNNFSMPWLWSAEKAAAKILENINRRKPEITFPRALHGLLSLLACMPHAWWASLSQLMQKPMENKP
ncbi:MAG TPA: SDR family NAD(P)-dependent oxidoreductase [Pseudomonadales bacterium]|nr:SDR family NAD(P)-dependent oxidoreductase [Pseudomonadales bacterium]